MMANPIQVAMDTFWSQLQSLEARTGALKNDLEADRLKLMALWSSTKRDPNRDRAAQNQALLSPQIHNNSVLRLKYRGLVAAFNKVLGITRETLIQAGYQPPDNLAGLGVIAPFIVPTIAAAALATAFLIYQSIRTATDSQRRATAALAKLVEDPTASPAARAAAAAALGKSAQPGGLVQQLVPVLGILAALVFLPSLLPKRRPA
mgnify:CR=1 FL=1